LNFFLFIKKTILFMAAHNDDDEEEEVGAFYAVEHTAGFGFSPLAARGGLVLARATLEQPDCCCLHAASAELRLLSGARTASFVDCGNGGVMLEVQWCDHARAERVINACLGMRIAALQLCNALRVTFAAGSVYSVEAEERCFLDAVLAGQRSATSCDLDALCRPWNWSGARGKRFARALRAVLAGRGDLDHQSDWPQYRIPHYTCFAARHRLASRCFPDPPQDPAVLPVCAPPCGVRGTFDRAHCRGSFTVAAQQ
jgi:hypothetical protein